MRTIWRLRADERGIALVLALGIMVVLGISVAASVSYTTANTRSVSRDGGRVNTRAFADSAANYAVGILGQQIATGADPAAANLLGCAGLTGSADTNGPSNCTTPTPKLLCLNGSTTCTAGAADTATVYGYYSGTNAGTYNGITVPAATWLLVMTGYAFDSSIGQVVAHTSTAKIAVSPLNAGSVASVWNHVFLTAPLVPNVCQTDFSGNNMVVDVPLYILGNLCISGNNTVVKEVGQAVDLQVGGKLSLSGSNSSVGVSAGTPISSGVVVGGCTTGLVTTSTTACTPASYRYWVTTPDTFNSQIAPSETASDITKDYNTFDPGPKHACQSGTNPAPLASTVFDNNTAYDSSAASFELTPAFSYSCLSTSGATIGQLTWNNTTKTLTVAGSIFIDGNVTISQSAYYTGLAIIEASGSFTMNGNGTTLCATSPCNTALTAWQGSSGNNSMLTFAALVSNGTGLTMVGNSQTFQGSLWTQPSSTVVFTGNNITVEGPMSIGKIGSGVNNASLKPLPIIKNMPVGAPVPPNTGATLGKLSFIG